MKPNAPLIGVFLLINFKELHTLILGNVCDKMNEVNFVAVFHNKEDVWIKHYSIANNC
jgi:hypothetical protein